MTSSIVLADDHPLVRRGLRSLLESEPEFSVAGEAADGLETLRLTQHLKPDVLVLDLMMPGLSGLEILRILKESQSQTRIVILSFYSSAAFIAAALKNGATGYVLKGCDENDVLQAVREAIAGRRFLSPQIATTAINAYIEQLKEDLVDPHELLTVREREVLQLSAEGKSGPAIAARLQISLRTVENHRTHLMKKLGLENQTELVCHSLRHGLITLDE